MATKTEIQNLIDMNLANEIGITAEAHREVENAFVDELYPDTFVDTKNTPPQKILCLQPDKVSEYTFITSKSGNMVTIQGYYILIIPSPLGENLFQIIDENYELPVGQILHIPTNSNNVSYGDNIMLLTRLTGNNISGVNSLLAQRRIFFSITYRAK